MNLHKMLKILHRAQETYGYANQVSVAAEECMELALVLQKYPRYNTHTDFCESMDQKEGMTMRERVVEEVGDVCIILQHLYTMFGISPEEVDKTMNAKLERLERWMDTDPSFQHTTVDREVNIPTEGKCGSCGYFRKSGAKKHDLCHDCEFGCNWVSRGEA